MGGWIVRRARAGISESLNRHFVELTAKSRYYPFLLEISLPSQAAATD